MTPEEWRSNPRRWDRRVLLELAVGTRVMEDGIGVKRTTDDISWFVYYRAPIVAGSRRTKTVHEYLANCPNKTQAAATLTARKASVHAGTFKRQERGLEITMEQLGKAFIAASKALRSWKRYEQIVRIHIVPFFRPNALASTIDKEAVDNFYAQKLITEKLPPASCNYMLTTVSLMFKLALERNFVSENPAKGTRRKKANNRRERMFSSAEVGALVGAAMKRDDYLRPLFVVLLGTGMRLGEALALPWADVDLENGMLRIRDSKNYEGRWVLLAADVLTELRRWRAVVIGEPFVFPSRPKKDGTRTHITEVKKGWAALCKTAGVKTTRHELRHNFISQALAAGYSPADIMPVTGHKSIRAFEGYAHSMAERKRALAEAVVSDFLRRLPGDCSPLDDKSDSPDDSASS